MSVGLLRLIGYPSLVTQMSETAATFDPSTSEIAPAATTRTGHAVVRGTKAIEAWLWTIAFLIAGMVLVGGITRLTGSGLSITEWRPVTGFVPPFSAKDWSDLFTKYQTSPQFRVENAHLDLAGFKMIFWWEWAHRFIARLIGFFVVIPWAFFWWRKQLDRWLVRRILLLFALGALQGALGWLMVASGLVDIPRVSHFRLAAHLMMAYGLLVLTVWTALEVRARGKDRRTSTTLAPGAAHSSTEPFSAESSAAKSASIESASIESASIESSSANASSANASSANASSANASSANAIEVRYLIIFGGLLVAQIIFGAFVAGLRAGYMFPTFPKMGSEWFPSESILSCASSSSDCGSLWKIFLTHGPAVQFVHRWLGASVAAFGVGLTALGLIRSRGRAGHQRAWLVFASAVVGQFALGIVTMLGFYSSPVFLGAAHQAGATLLVVVTVVTLNEVRANRSKTSLA